MNCFLSENIATNFNFRNSTFSDQTITKSFGFLVEKSIKSFNGMVFRNEGRSLIGYLLQKVADVGGKVSRFRVIGVCIFSFRVARMFKHEGVKGVVLTLKTSHVLLMQSLAGYRITDQGPLKRRVRRDRTGLPLWIPRKHRELLRAKDNGIIRLWSSLLALYRVLEMPGTLKLNSITDGGPKLDLLSLEDKKQLNEVINRFWDRLNLPRLKDEYRGMKFTLFPIGTSSPQTVNSTFSLGEESWSSRVISSTPLNIWGYARIWLAKQNVWFYEHMLAFLESTDQKDWFLTTLWKVGVSDFDKLVPAKALEYFSFEYKSENLFLSRWLGKLGFKEEPAGKVRVFAMVDVWTQWLFYPLHKFIQGILRNLNEDATFDQVGKLERKLLEMQKKYRKAKAFSYDLSSATDRLPVLLQVYILRPLLGLKSAIGWANVLITRKYFISGKTAEKYGIKESDRSLAYAVGQPMGALSSWVMLALTHHIIVQWAFYSAKTRRLKGEWFFKDYIVLGDDVVIFDPLTAARYYFIMTKKLGVEIGLAKSIVSKSSWTLEFAKKYYVDGMKANMLPLRDVIVTSIATSMLPEFIKKHSVTFNHYLKLRGLGYKARAKLTANLWNMPQRLRVYTVLQAREEMNWLEWISLKRAGTHFILNREILMKIYFLILDDRLAIRKRLVKLGKQLQDEWNFGWQHPQFELGTSSEGRPPDRDVNPFPGYHLLEQFEYPPLWWPSYQKAMDNLTLVELRERICDLHMDNDHWSEKSMDFKNLTWFTYVHSPEKSFRDLQSLYRDWVRYNSVFLKHWTPSKRSVKSELSESLVKTPGLSLMTLPMCKSLSLIVWGDIPFEDFSRISDVALKAADDAEIEPGSTRRVAEMAIQYSMDWGTVWNKTKNIVMKFITLISYVWLAILFAMIYGGSPEPVIIILPSALEVLSPLTLEVDNYRGVEPFVLFGLILCALLIFVAFRTITLSDKVEMDRLISELTQAHSQVDSLNLELTILRQSVEVLTRSNIEVLAHLDVAHGMIDALSSM